VNLKTLSVVAMALSLGACASVPPPPHCEDNGKGMQPINPEMLTQEQINAHRAAHQAKPNNQLPLGHPRNGGHH
jgi:Flp pilus assembly protein TadD